MGVVTPAPMRTYPDGLPAPSSIDALRAVTGRGVLCIRPYTGRGHRGLRRASTSRRATCRLHVAGLRAPGGRARRRRAARRALAACAAMRAVMQGEHAWAASSPGRSWARPARSSAPTAGATSRSSRPAAPTWTAAGGRAAGPRRRQGGGGLRRRRRRRPSTRARRTRRRSRRSTRSPRGLDAGLVFAEPRRDRPGLRPPPRRAGLPARARAIDGAVGGWLPQLDPPRPARPHRRPRVRPDDTGTDHTREHVPLLARVRGHGGRRHDGPMADVGASCTAG